MTSRRKTVRNTTVFNCFFKCLLNLTHYLTLSPAAGKSYFPFFFQLMRSRVQGQKLGGASETSRIRTSKNGWLPDSASPIVGKLTKRVGQIVGLDASTWLESSELLQVTLRRRVNGNVVVFKRLHQVTKICRIFEVRREICLSFAKILLSLDPLES